MLKQTDQLLQLHEKEQAPAFHGVFTAKTADELKRVYDCWAETYDHTLAYDLAGDGQNHPTTELIAVLASAVPTTASIEYVLDVGAGTGAAGPLLVQQYGGPKGKGLKALVAFDLSEGMLKVAEQRQVYTAIVQGCCPNMEGARKVLSTPEGTYDLVVCAGTFTPNHAPASTLAELVELVRPGGFIAFSVRSYFFDDESSGFKSMQEELVSVGKWNLIADQERVYLPKENVLARYFVYQVAANPEHLKAGTSAIKRQKKN